MGKRVLIFLMALSCSMPLTAEQLRVFTLHAYHQEYPWTKGQHDGFVQALHEAIPERDIMYSTEYLDTKRTPLSEDYQDRIFEYLKFKYAGYRPDLIYATDDDALRFLLSYRDLFSGVPVFFSGVSDLTLLPGLNGQIHTGVFEQKAPLANVQLARMIAPATRQIIFVGDASETFKVIRARVLSQMSAYPELRYRFLADQSLPVLVDSLRRSRQAVLILATLGSLRNAQGQIVPLQRAVAALAGTGHLTLTMEDVYLTSGVLGGYVTSSRLQGMTAGRLAARYLEGAAVAEIPPITDSPNRYMFDQQALRRHGIKLDPALAEMAEMVNEPQSFYEANRRLILGIMGFLAIAISGALSWSAITARRKNRIIEARTRQAAKSIALLNEYKKAVDATSIVSKTNRDGVITYVNDAFLRAFGYEKKEVIGKSHNLVRHPDTSVELYRELWGTIASNQPWHGVMKSRAKDGRTLFVDTTIVPILDEVGKIREYIATRTDVTRLMQQEALIQEQTTDPLTGLPNRVALLQALKQVERPILALINIDDLKEINEFFGLEIGDEVLQALAGTIRKQVPGDHLYRFAGDEFALLAVPPVTLPQFEAGIIPLAELLESTPVRCRGQEISVGVTIGIAAGPDNLTTRAGMALKHARDNKKHYAVYDDSMQPSERYEENLQRTRQLKSAITGDRIVPFFQPIVDNDSRQVARYEALARIIDEQGRVVPATVFLEVARRSKQYSLVTRRILDKALAAFTERSEGLAINISVDDIRDPYTADYLRHKVAASGLAQRVILEITEGEGIADYDEVAGFIAGMKSIGCKIAVDDFGTGYSNFIYLMRLNPDFIKIDGSIISTIVDDRHSQLVTQMIVWFAQRAGIETVAEFVSTEAIMKKARELGVDYSQGNHIGEPGAELRAAPLSYMS